MEKEYLDIVDEKNNLTGEKVLRSEAHAKGIWHRVVHIYLFRKNQGEIEFIVHMRSKFKDLYPNAWDTRFGGHIKSGTSIKEAVDSELKDEIGIEINQKNLIEGPLHKIDDFPNCELAKAYFFEYVGNINDLKFDDGEVQEVKWMNIQEIKKSMEKEADKWADDLPGFEKVSNCLINKEK